MKIDFTCMANEINSFKRQIVCQNAFDCSLVDECYQKASWQRLSVAKGIYEILKQNDVEMVPLFWSVPHIAEIPYKIISHRIYQIEKETMF